jgi:hypothetical protein
MNVKCIKCGVIRKWYHLFGHPCGHKQHWAVSVSELDNVKIIKDTDVLMISSMPEKKSANITIGQLKEYILNGKKK